MTDLVAKKYLHWHRTSVKIELLGLFWSVQKCSIKKTLKKFHEGKTNTRKTLLLKKTPTCSTSQVSKEERGKYCCGLPFNVNIAASQWKYQCLNKKTIAAIQSWSWTVLITIRGGALKSLVAMKRRISSRDQLFYFVSTKTTLEWRYFRSSFALNIDQNVLLYWNCDQTFIVSEGSLHLILFNISAPEFLQRAI